MNFWVRSHTDSLCSWTVVRKALVKSLTRLGFTVHDSNTPPRDAWEWIELWWGAAADWDWSETQPKLRVGLTLAEGDQIPEIGKERAIAILRRCDILFVPSPASKRAFLELPIDTPIYYWPLGVDLEMFRYQPKKFAKINFLHAGWTQFRKGSWLAAEAFVKAFGLVPPDDARLTFSSYANPREPEMMQTLRQEYKAIEAIQFISENYDNPANRYVGHNVLISPHLSEGWGLCITEAMALGLPCIVSRTSAPRDYFSDKCGWWIEMSTKYAPVSNCLTDTSGFWRLPDVEDLANKMRYVYDHRDECERKSIVAAKYAKSLSWERGIQRAIPKIKERL